MNSYELSRNWFDWCFENPEKVNPNHTAIYFFCIEHCNRMGWKDKFGFPSQMTMDAIGIKKHQTYIKYFRDLVDWGFIILIQESKNQYSSNIVSLKIALPKKVKAYGKALDKAFINHSAKQTETIGQSNSSIDKQLNKEQETINNDFIDSSLEILKTNSAIENCKQNYLNNRIAIEALAISTHQPIERIEKRLNEFCTELISKGNTTYLQNDFNQYFVNWFKKKIQQVDETKVFVMPQHVHR